MKNDDELSRAWKWREERGLLADSGALRVFHGPGEGSGARSAWAIDRFGDHYWITRWEGAPGERGSESKTLAEFADFLKARGARSVVWLGRPEKGVPALPTTLHGTAPSERFEVSEEGRRFWIRLLDARHPGLFLDHAPLRGFLQKRAQGWKTLNTFAYTGSLSVAAGLGGASHVTTLDLSKATVQWAEDNWSLNGLASDRGRFISGDVFEWLPRLRREGQVFDCAILDPPSFSHGKKGTFSTAKDLKKLHELALDVLAPESVLVTSINSANVPWAKYESELGAAAREKRCELRVLGRIDLPETFPTRLGQPEDRYLKGWILRVSKK